MRAPHPQLAALLAGLLIGCGGFESSSDRSGTADAPEADGTNEPPAGAPFGGCSIDAECEAVASSCCECPTFALPIDQGVGGVCEDVTCDGPIECPAQEAICGASGACELACSEVACDISCANGFVQDEAGCAVCACLAEAPAPECGVAADCAQVAADCCGCERGGASTAVAIEAVSAFQDSLGCTGSEVCPEIDTCNSSEEVQCSYGRCVLADTASEDPQAPVVCGTSEVPTCPEGDVCVLNAREYPMIAAAGLGVCEPL